MNTLRSIALLLTVVFAAHAVQAEPPAAPPAHAPTHDSADTNTDPIPEHVPEPLRPFYQLVESCKLWQRRDRATEWREVYQSQFDKDPEQWPKLHKWARVVKTDGRAELHLVPPDRTTMSIPIGPKVRGEFAIEAVCRVEGNGANPISILTSADRDGGPGFQFNCLDTGEHRLWCEPTNLTAPAERFRIGNRTREPKLEVGRTYTLRLEVRNHLITTYLDGAKFAAAPTSAHYQWMKWYQPTALTVGPTKIIQSWRIEMAVPKSGLDAAENEADRWRIIFKGATHEQVVARIARLVQYLNHDDWAVRSEAEVMLRGANSFAHAALTKAVNAESPELVMRAQRLLKSISPPAEALPLPDPQPDPQPEPTLESPTAE